MGGNLARCEATIQFDDEIKNDFFSSRVKKFAVRRKEVHSSLLRTAFPALAEILNTQSFNMSKFTLTSFGEIDSDNLEEYYDAEITINGRVIEVDISFDEKSIAIDKLKKINNWLADVQKLDELGLTTIRNDYSSGDTVKEYIKYHLDELDGDDLKTLINQAKAGKTKEEKLLYSIKLKLIGFYPHTDERFVNLDYTLDNDLTDYLVVLDFTEDGNLHYITLES